MNFYKYFRIYEFEFTHLGRKHSSYNDLCDIELKFKMFLPWNRVLIKFPCTFYTQVLFGETQPIEDH